MGWRGWGWGGGGRTTDLGALRTPGNFFVCFEKFLGFVHVRFCMLWVSDWLRAVLAAICKTKTDYYQRGRLRRSVQLRT